METMHAAGRRRLPPVPRPAGDRPSTGQLTVERPEATRTQPDATELIDTRQIAAELIEAELIEAERAADGRDASDDDTTTLNLPDLDTEAAEDSSPEEPAADEPAAGAPVLDSAALEPAVLENLLLPAPADEQDPAQQFVARLRASAADFAAAAGAESAVVREAVPPARHRRARCRLVLRYLDGTEIDVTLLGPAGRPGRPSRHGFDRQILRWLGAGLSRDESWLTDDPDAPDGVAVDLTSWIAAS
jgi:hypothetical protein